MKLLDCTLRDGGYYTNWKFDDDLVRELVSSLSKSGVDINLKKLIIKFGNIKIIEKGQLVKNYKESDVASYMKNQAIDISINLDMGLKKFTAYTMDMTKEYIEINADYRS